MNALKPEINMMKKECIMLDENGGELLGDHNFVAEIECKTDKITFDLWG